MSDTISAKLAVEKILSERISQDPGFITELTLDPDGAVKPLIAQVLSDDGDVDLSGVSITVHVETDDRIHLVVPATVDADVEGFSLKSSPGSMLRGTSVSFNPLGGMTRSSLATHSGVCVCDSMDCETQVYCDLTNTCK